MSRKDKRKYIYRFVDPSTGRFTSKQNRKAVRRRYSIVTPKRVFRNPKTGRFSAPGKRKGAGKPEFVEIPLGRGGKRIQPEFERDVISLDAREVVYNVPFVRTRKKVGKKRTRNFYEPDRERIESVFNQEIKLQAASGKTFHTAACKCNVHFKDDKSDSWITIPIGRRIPVDEPGGYEDMYGELVKFLFKYEIAAVLQIQLSILRLPL